MTRLRELEDEIKTLRNWNAQLLRQIDQLETDQQLKRLEVVEFKSLKPNDLIILKFHGRICEMAIREMQKFLDAQMPKGTKALIMGDAEEVKIERSDALRASRR